MRIVASLSRILLELNLLRRDVDGSRTRLQTCARFVGSVSVKSNAKHDKRDDEQNARHGLVSTETAQGYDLQFDSCYARGCRQDREVGAASRYNVVTLNKLALRNRERDDESCT